MSIKRVALIGAGAVGSYIIWGLTKKPDVEFILIADGDRKEQLIKSGVTINGVKYTPRISSASEAGTVDLVIVALKFNALQSALGSIRRLCGKDTMIMSLMNGVESEDIIAETTGREHIIPALIKIASARNGSSIVFDPETTIGIIYGEYNAENKSRTEAISELFDHTGLHYRITDHILSEIWAKFRFNVSMNQAQAMIGCGVGAYRDSAHAAYLRDGLKHEVEALAEAKGIDLSLAAASSSHGSKVRDGAFYSTLQDLQAHRHTEVDMFAGTVVKMGKEMNIPTPFNDIAYHVIKALEEKNDGLFDYE